jgi:hypothetical protein
MALNLVAIALTVRSAVILAQRFVHSSAGVAALARLQGQQHGSEFDLR